VSIGASVASSGPSAASRSRQVARSAAQAARRCLLMVQQRPVDRPSVWWCGGRDACARRIRGGEQRRRLRFVGVQRWPLNTNKMSL